MKRTAGIIAIIICLLTGKNVMSQNGNTDLEIDPRIANHYSTEQINELKQTNNLEIKKLNHYFQNSFILVPTDIPNSPTIDLLTIDARRFENQRHATERTTIIISANNDQLILKSKAELEVEYKLIK